MATKAKLKRGSKSLGRRKQERQIRRARNKCRQRASQVGVAILFLFDLFSLLDDCMKSLCQTV